MGVLPILRDEPRFAIEALPFEQSLAHLVARRVAKFRVSLSAAMPTIDDVTVAVVDRLMRLEPAEPRLVHGDLIPANVLVDERSRPVAVLDFGFMSTVGDPAFDAAVTASIFDMYGPRSAENEGILDRAFAQRFGYEAGRLALYRAAYALSTSNCYSPAGTDGHFAWCVQMLQRSDVRRALQALRGR